MSTIETTTPFLDRASLSVRHLMHPEKTRYAMNGICIDPKGVIATNGKAMAWVAQETGKDHVVWNKETVKALVKATRLKGASVTLGVGLLAKVPGKPARGKTPAREEKSYGISPVKSQGLFPPWEDVIPNLFTGYYETDVALSDLELLADVPGSFAEGSRIQYCEKGFLSVSARVPERGDVTLKLASAVDEQTHEIGIAPALLADCCKVLREFLPKDAVRCRAFLPEGKGYAKKALVFKATRGDRELTILLMPLII